MKTIMKTINSKTCANVMNLIQSILVIKNKREAKAIQKLIDKYGFADIYVYCSKDRKGQLHYSKEHGAFYDIYKGPEHYSENGNLNGKVVFKFRCYKVEEITPQMWTPKIEQEILEKSCLKENELFDYICSHDGTEDRPFYAIHISDLEIFDKPKELNEFCGVKQYFVGCEGGIDRTPRYAVLTKAPKNFCYFFCCLEVENEEKD